MTARHPRSLTHVGITVPDAEAAMEWYRDVVGLDVLVGPHTIERGEPGWEWATDPLDVEFDTFCVVQLTTGNGVGVECFQFDGTHDAGETDPVSPGYFHVGVLDPDVEGLANRIDENGGDHYARVWERGDSGERVTYCRDPWGNRIEVYSQSFERFVG